MATGYSGPNTGPTGLVAGADLSAVGNLHKFVKLDGAGKVVLCAVAGEFTIGVLETGGKLDEAVRVSHGQVTVLAAAAIAAGQRIAVAADGRAEPATLSTLSDGTVAGAANDVVVGYALTAAAAAGEYISAWVAPVPGTSAK